MNIGMCELKKSLKKPQKAKKINFCESCTNKFYHFLKTL